MTKPYGIIADDFTGATDVASLIARNGARVIVHAGIPDTSARKADVHVVALKCRTSPVSDATDQSRSALNWLRERGCGRIYWKYCSTFDSTDQGNIGPVSEALMRALGVDETVYCPSFPENRRTVYQGNLFVGDQLLNESPMKDHPLTPMRDADLCRLLQPQVRGQVGLISWQTVQDGAEAIIAARKSLSESGIKHHILDALDSVDLATLASACADLRFATGGSAFAAALHAQAFPHMQASQLPEPPPGPTLILSGSCSHAKRDQVAHHVSRDVPALQITPDRIGDAHTQGIDLWLANAITQGEAMVYSTADPDELGRAQTRYGPEDAASRIEQEMARIARAAFDLGTRRFIVAGGETSGAVTQALDATELAIGGEIAPGVPWCLAETRRGNIALVLKSGNFGNPDFFGRATQELEGNAQCMS